MITPFNRRGYRGAVCFPRVTRKLEVGPALSVGLRIEGFFSPRSQVQTEPGGRHRPTPKLKDEDETCLGSGDGKQPKKGGENGKSPLQLHFLFFNFFFF